jgi:hypothetical protein
MVRSIELKLCTKLGRQDNFPDWGNGKKRARKMAGSTGILRSRRTRDDEYIEV